MILLEVAGGAARKLRCVCQSGRKLKMCSRDDYHDLDKAAAEVRRAKEELKRAEEAYTYIKNHVKQSH